MQSLLLCWILWTTFLKYVNLVVKLIKNYPEGCKDPPEYTFSIFNNKEHYTLEENGKSGSPKGRIIFFYAIYCVYATRKRLKTIYIVKQQDRVWLYQNIRNHH